MRQKRLLRVAVITTPVVLAALGVTSTVQAQASSSAGSGAVTVTSAQAAALSRDVTDKVIVVFKNQLASLPDTPADSMSRAGAVGQLQQGVLAELKATHSRDVRSISLVNAVAATVSAGTAKLIAANPAVAEVVSDLPIPV